jgi:hypothetical protein
MTQLSIDNLTRLVLCSTGGIIFLLTGIVFFYLSKRKKKPAKIITLEPDITETYLSDKMQDYAIWRSTKEICKN